MGWLWALGLGYLFGSVPFGLILTRAGGAGDLRQIGSGSIGATNVLRTGHKGLAAATLGFDALKGLAAVLIAARLWPDTAGYAAIGAIVGHCFPIWLGFKGGKGVATALGIALALAWPVAVICGAVWLSVLAITRYSSLSGMTAVVVGPLAAGVLGYSHLIVAFAAIAVVVLWRHRANIARLRAGIEPKVGAKP